VKNTARWGLSSLVVVAATGAFLLPASAAFASGGTPAPAPTPILDPVVSLFSCPEGTDTIDVPFGFTADALPELAGTVCVHTGTTVFDTMNVTPGWTARLRSDGSDGRTEVQFTSLLTRDNVELRYEAGRTEIK
jgi:hypothetical protein